MKYSLLCIFILLFSNASCNTNADIEQLDFVTENDSISILIEASKNKKLNRERRIFFVHEAYNYVKKISHDSIKNLGLLKVSFEFYRLKDSLSFRKVNKASMNLSIKVNDSMSWAANYWDLGNFLSQHGIKDSAYLNYSRAQKIYENMRNDHFSGRMLLNMAIMQSDIKDYTGSEITTIKAISKLKPLNKYRHLYRCYNNLAINFNNLEEFDKAIENHQIALEYQKKIKRKNTFKESTLNNIGVVHKNKKDYSEAIRNYRAALATVDLKKRRVKLYAKLLDNLAYSEFKLNNLGNTKEQLHESLRIRDSINDFMGIAVNKLHLAEYYMFLKDTVKALQYAKEASLLSRNTKNYRELLPSLLLLSKIDKSNSAYYTDDYIKLSDSLQKQERAIRNKFARIKFQTDEFIVKNERLNRQKETILIISGLLLLFGTLLYVIRHERVRNKTLLLEKEQQEANEEIYNLMISQQNKLDEGSKKAKKRISEELHDGVLGKLFGTRLILGNLNSSIDEETVLKREKYINELQEIEEEVRNVSHELNSQSVLFDANSGYAQMLETLIEDQSEITNFNYEFINDKTIRWEEKEGSLKMNLYRIIQEAVQNINKYAKAKNVLVEFKTNSNTLFLLIKDDGVGFNQKSKSNGIGLANIQSRAEKFDGKVDIVSSLNKGTSIEIKIPNG